MAVNLPKSMQFVEYRPSMQGIPTQAVSRLYDRLDAEALRTEAAANKVQQALGANIAIAAEGDKPYLQNLFGQMETIMNTAQEEGNLPGYAKQIRKLANDIAASPEYATIRNNSRLSEEYRKTNMNLATQFGQENIVASGDDPSTFSSIGPNGELRQFQGFAMKRPDYLKGMDDVYMKNVDIVGSRAAMEKFVDDGQALAAYLQTPEGRVHVNEVNRSMGNDTPFHRMQPDDPRAVGVMQQMNALLKDAGERYIKTKKDTIPEKYEDLKNKGIITSGIAGTSLTDGTKGTDATIGILDDQVKDSELDNQLTALVKYDQEIMLYPDASGNRESIERGSAIQSNQIKGSTLTTQKGPNGLPLIMVEYNNNVAGKGSDQTIGYYEISREDLPFVQQAMTGTLYQLRNYTTQANRGAAASAIANIYEPDLNAWANTSMSEPYTAATAGYEIRRQNDKYYFYDTDGNPFTVGGNQLNFEKINEVTDFIGLELINNK